MNKKTGICQNKSEVIDGWIKFLETNTHQER